MGIVTRDIANYISELILIGGGTSSPKTPLFDLCASLGNIRRRPSMLIPMSTLVAPDAASQTVLTEAASAVAQTATDYDRSQLANVMEIIQRTVTISATKQASAGEREGINIAGDSVPLNEVDFQINRALLDVKMHIENSMINGTYVADGGSAVGSKTSGLLEAITLNLVPAAGADISKAMLNELVNEMVDNGAYLENGIILCGNREMSIINDLYGFATQDTFSGGTMLREIWTSKAKLTLVYEPYMPAGSLVIADVNYIKPSFLALPAVLDGVSPVNPADIGSGLDVAVYDSSSGGASIKKIIQANFGLDYTCEALHGKVTGLKTA